jgi:hypothetical protein
MYIMALNAETIREVKYALEEAEMLEFALNAYDERRLQSNASKMSGVPLKLVRKVYSETQS